LPTHGIDPSAKGNEAKAAKGNCFEDIAGEWMQKQELAEVTIAKEPVWRTPAAKMNMNL
jgi:hypothetical protein